MTAIENLLRAERPYLTDGGMETWLGTICSSLVLSDNL